MTTLTKLQYKVLVAKNKRAERKEMRDAIIGGIAIAVFAILWFSFL
jgi:hypothetical protein